MESRGFFLEPTIKETICKNLTFEEAIQLREALNLPSLDCPIIIKDPSNFKEITLPGVNSDTIAAYKLILINGLNSALLWASYSDIKNSVIQILLNVGADINTTNFAQKTPLMVATEKNNQLMVEILIANGAKIDTVDQSGKTALYFAAKNGYDSIGQKLLEAGADVTKSILNIATPSAFQLLAKEIGKLNANDPKKGKFLRWASESGRIQFVQLLIDSGIEVDMPDQYGKTALMLASIHKRDQIAKILLKAGAQINAVDPNGDTSLIFAASHGYDSLVKILVEAGADINIVDQSNNTALGEAVRFGYSKVIEILTKKHLQNKWNTLKSWIYG